MMTVWIILNGVLLAGMVILGVWLWRRGGGQRDTALQLLQQQMLAAVGQQDQRLATTTEQLTGALGTLTQSLTGQLAHQQILSQETQKALTERLDAAGRTLGDLKGQLGELGAATANVIKVGSDVRQLQDILQSPKLRGGLGEWLLENLLAEVLPVGSYELQYRFRNGTIVDALVKLAQGSVGIDAKFPLPNFQVMLAAGDDAARLKARKAFLKDVRNRIDEIRSKYILPDEGTLDFALMYVPAENVYYELLLTGGEDVDISAYAREQRVIPVSPNTLYAYLKVIALGLKGMQIERHAQVIYQQLSHLAGDLELFMGDFALVGKHLSNAVGKHDEARRRLDLLTQRLAQIDRPTS